MRTPRSLTMVLASLLLASSAGAVPPVPGSQDPPQGMPGEKKMEESMMARHREMMTKMDAMDGRLDELVQKMNSAKGSKKTDATAAVVNELVAQRKQMRQQMMSMQPEMMRHMMEHMRMGMMKGMMESMAQCPMMKKMASPEDGAKKPGNGEHSEHHPQ